MSKKKNIEAAPGAAPASPAVNWKIAADRSVYGEKVELDTLPGYWVKPRRWSKTGEAEIHAALARIFARQRDVRNTIIRETSGDEPMSEADLMAGSLPEKTKEKIMAALTGSLDGETVDQVEAKIAKIAFGVHAHNFQGEPEVGSMEWARELVEYRDVFDEILGIVEEKNRPLPTTTPR